MRSLNFFIYHFYSCPRSSETGRHKEHMDNMRLYHQSLQEQAASHSGCSSSAGDTNPSSSMLFTALRYQSTHWQSNISALLIVCFKVDIKQWLFSQEKAERAWQHPEIFQPEAFNSSIPVYEWAGL